MRSRRYVAIVVAAVVAVTLMLCPRTRKRYYSHEGVVWTTEYHITYESSRDLSDSIHLLLGNMDMSVSPYNKASLLSAINDNEAGRMDGYLLTLYHASQSIHRESGGAYDATVMPLVNAWGFGYKSGTLPTRAQLDSILQFVGMDKVSVAPDGVITKDDPRVMLDFSSIAKGLACDEIGRMLQRNGADNWLVEIGGEVAARGVNARGMEWTVSVDMPADEQNGQVSHNSALAITLGNEAVATSGNYRKWRNEGGHKLSHIIDPRTGDSRAGTLLSVTVIARDCMNADAWSTACMVMGEEQVKHLMQGRDDLGVLTISADTITGNLIVWSNPSFAQRVR